MPKWLVRLGGERLDLEDLPSLLCSPEHTVIEEDGSYYLKSSDFDSLGSADEVRERALAIIEMLNGAMKLHIPSFRGVYEAGVTLIEEDGRRHHYVYLEASLTLRSKLSVNPTVTTSNGTRQMTPPPSDVHSWISLAKTDKAVADALHFFRDNTWISLYKVYEIIREDAGDEEAIIRNGWVTKQALTRFRQTAQSKAALGDLARHAASGFKPPSQPMTIQEAGSLLRGVILSWLSSKA
jgi:hypothetical protein